MRRFKDSIGASAATLLVVGLFGAAIWIEVSIWTECRTENSFFYCMRILSR